MQSLESSDRYREFIGQKRFAVIYFDASWNYTGQPLRSRVQTADTRFSGIANFGEVDADNAHEIAVDVHLTNVPAMAYYTDGTLVAAHVGASQDVIAQTEALIAGKTVDYITAKTSIFKQGW